jgi:hypothetical protein
MVQSRPYCPDYRVIARLRLVHDIRLLVEQVILIVSPYNDLFTSPHIFVIPSSVLQLQCRAHKTPRGAMTRPKTAPHHQHNRRSTLSSPPYNCLPKRQAVLRNSTHNKHRMVHSHSQEPKARVRRMRARTVLQTRIHPPCSYRAVLQTSDTNGCIASAPPPNSITAHITDSANKSPQTPTTLHPHTQSFLANCKTRMVWEQTR